MTGLTLDQLQKMGAKPVTPPQPSGGLTAEQLQQMGAKPLSQEQMIQQQKTERRKQGLPVSVRKDRVDPTLAGSIVRGIASVPLKVGLAVAAPVKGDKGITVKTKYLGDVSDPITNINKASDRLAEKYKAGEITKAGAFARAALGQPLIETLDVASLIPAGGAATGAIKATTGAVAKQAPKILTKELAKEGAKAFARGAGYGVGYDVGSQMASGEKYNPVQTVKSAAIGGALDAGLSVGLPAAISGTKRFAKNNFTAEGRGEKLRAKTENEIRKFEKYQGIKKITEYARSKGEDPVKMLAQSDALVGSVDNNGLVKTLGDGAAREKYYNQYVKPIEGVIRANLEIEGTKVPVSSVEESLMRSVNNSNLEGEALVNAYNKVAREIDGLKFRADADGNIDLTKIHDAKVNKYETIDYLNPASKKADKAIARTYKKLVEQNAKSIDTEKINKELGRHLDVIRLIEKLDNKRVEGGRLGKYVAQGIGAAIGSKLGPVGAMAGAEIGGRLKGSMMARTFSKNAARVIENSPEMMQALKNIDDAAELALKEQYKKKLRAMLDAKNVKPAETPSLYEPYIPQSKLPVIQAGNVARKAINLPVAEGTPKVYTPKPSVEPYIPTEKLPVIDMGEAPKPKKVNLPTVKANSTELPKVAAPESYKRSSSQEPTKKPITIEKSKAIDTKAIASQGGKVKSATINVDGKVVNVTPKTKASLESAKEMAKKKGTESAAYAVFGLEVDEDGEISYDPRKAAAFMFAGSVLGSEKSKEIFKGFSDLSLKTLERMAGKSKVSKQFILDQLKREDVVKPERVLMETMLKDMGDDISVNDFANRVKTELLPLKRNSSLANVKGANRLEKMENAKKRGGWASKYDGITLKENRGNVLEYKENVYESPIKTNAGEKHNFPTNSYFAHTRIEDMADGKTRRVIEVQSDLMQKGSLEKSVFNTGSKEFPYKTVEAEDLKNFPKQANDLKKLKAYEEDWFKRIIPEEVKAAAQDGKLRVLFPTGETAMKVEGLGSQSMWMGPNGALGLDMPGIDTAPKVGMKIVAQGDSEKWIITEVLEDGKFKAVPEETYKIDKAWSYYEDDGNYMAVNKITDDVTEFSTKEDAKEWIKNRKEHANSEQFDISGKIDTSNPIYRFYDGDVKKYLKRFNAKEITDENGVSWFEVLITKEMKDMPVGAFGYIAPSDRPKVELPKSKAKVTLPKKK